MFQTEFEITALKENTLKYSSVCLVQRFFDRDTPNLSNC